MSDTFNIPKPKKPEVTEKENRTRGVKYVFKFLKGKIDTAPCRQKEKKRDGEISKQYKTMRNLSIIYFTDHYETFSLLWSGKVTFTIT